MNKFKRAVKEIRDMRIANEKREYEETMDEWFKNLTILQKADVAYNFWDNARYKEKKEEYELV